MKSIKVFSFFSGSGFLDLGFEKSGFHIELVNEISVPFIESYKHSRMKMGMRSPRYGYFNIDINDFLLKRYYEMSDYLKDSRTDGSVIGFIGGSPCPDFSIAGKNKGRNGINGKLFTSYIALITKLKPDFFFFENVKGLWKTAKHREFFEELKEEIFKAGYSTTERLTNALEFGVPQDRERILLFGVRKELLDGYQKGNILLNFPWEKYIVYNLDTIRKIKWPTTNKFIINSKTNCPTGIPKEITVEYWFRKNNVEKHVNAKDYFMPRRGLQRIETIEEGDTSRKSYKRLHRWKYSPTVAYGNNEVHLHPYKARRISVAEALALQSLPKEFELPAKMTLTNKFKTIGNGVPFLLALGIARSIKEYIEKL